MRSYQRPHRHPNKAFTLIELLVVLAIIGLLAAILFPIFRSTKERANQTNCATNLRQIGVALAQYKADEKRYPQSLRDLLPNTAEIVDYGQSPPKVWPDPDSAVVAEQTTAGTGFLKTTRESLVCKDDDSDELLPRSSYGDISTGFFGPGYAPVGPGVAEDMGRFVWNFWGYDSEGIAYVDAAAAQSNTPVGRLADTGGSYHWKNNPVKYSLSNRYAPPGTIVTHCVYHRRPTARNINNPQELYTASASDVRDARDIILRLDGSVRTLDVTAFKNNGNWQNPTF